MDIKINNVVSVNLVNNASESENKKNSVVRLLLKAETHSILISNLVTLKRLRRFKLL